MASGSVVVSNGGDNVEWLANNTNSIIVDCNPISIADTLEYYLNHKDELELFRQAGLEFSSNTSWDAEFEKIRQFILQETNLNA